MKIHIFSLCRNEVDLLPFYLRHYGAMADRITIWDDQSTDGSKELIAAHPKAVLCDWPHDNGIDEDRFLAFAHEHYQEAAGFDWVIWVDIDEFIFHQNIREVLENASGFDVVRPDGFNMMCEGLPVFDGRQIWEIEPNGVAAPVYSKPVILRPTAKVRWVRGKHDMEGCTPRVLENSGVKLLHYRFMGADYTRQRNARNYARCGLKSGDKAAAWSCSPDHTGEHSPQWAESAMKLKTNVLT